MGRARQPVTLLGQRGRGSCRPTKITGLLLDRAATGLAGEADGNADNSHLVQPLIKVAMMLPYQAVINAGHFMTF
jgi:hypothetical protein